MFMFEIVASQADRSGLLCRQGCCQVASCQAAEDWAQPQRLGKGHWQATLLVVMCSLARCMR